jgi:hypothetical protein
VYCTYLVRLGENIMAGMPSHTSAFSFSLLITKSVTHDPTIHSAIAAMTCTDGDVSQPMLKSVNTSTAPSNSVIARGIKSSERGTQLTACVLHPLCTIAARRLYWLMVPRDTNSSQSLMKKTEILLENW